MGPEEFFHMNENNESSNDDYMRRVSRMMFIDDLENFPLQPISITTNQFKELFDEPNKEDKEILTECFIKDYLRIGNTKNGNVLILKKWSMDWITFLMKYNERVEEYEILKEVFDEDYSPWDFPPPEDRSWEFGSYNN